MEKLAKKILVVDDEEDIRDSLAFCLKKQGYTLLLAASGNEALRLAEVEKPDLVITDVRMADGDGVQLATQLRAKHPCEPAIIFITGYADLTVEEVYAMGVEAIFPKPFDLHQLQSTVLAVIQNQDEKWSCRSTRVAVDVPVGLRIEDHPIEKSGQVTNIARGGMFVKMVPDASMVGKPCAFELECEQSNCKQKVVGEGFVKWVRVEDHPENPAGCGIEFRPLAKQNNVSLLEFVNFLKTKCLIPRF